MNNMYNSDKRKLQTEMFQKQTIIRRDTYLLFKDAANCICGKGRDEEAGAVSPVGD